MFTDTHAEPQNRLPVTHTAKHMCPHSHEPYPPVLPGYYYFWGEGIILFFSFFFFVFLPFLGPLPAAYGGSQARGPIGTVAASLHTPQPQQRRIRALSATYTTAHSNV